MPKESLYKICLKRVRILLMKETWKYCSVNPFSNFPSKIIDDVMELMKIESIHLLRPLITSNRLTRLKLSSAHFQAESYLFQEETLKNCFECLRFLNCCTPVYSHIALIQKLLRSSPQLEEFHSLLEIPLDALETCKQLKVLRFYQQNREIKCELSNKRLAILASLTNLKVVRLIATMDTESIVKIIKHCPQLISIGCVDSLNALEKIHAHMTRESETEGTDISVQLQFKRCFWGKGIFEFVRMENDDVNLYKSSFPDKIKTAISLCPLVEELVFRVNHPDSIGNLKNLKRLARLEIRFQEYYRECMENFIAVLEVIGQKLKYLNVVSAYPVPVDIVCGFCPQLQYLKILSFATTIRSFEPHHNVSLKRLYVKKSDESAVKFLLATCKGLVELIFDDAYCLNDSLLDQILGFNPLAQLKLCIIIKSRLSLEGYKMILKKLVSVEAVRIGHYPRIIKSVDEILTNKLNFPNETLNEMLMFQDDFHYNF